MRGAGAGGEAKVEQVAVEARRLVTVGPSALFWTADGNEAASLGLVEQWRGVIVRVQPPANATDEQQARLGALLAKWGAAKVRFDSRAQADALPAAEQPRAKATAREVVMGMAAQSKCVAELQRLLDLELAKVGL